jgi:hypothetical protein
MFSLEILSELIFFLFKDGIFYHPDPIDEYEAEPHTVLVIGFGTELINGIDEDYWIIQNSYGPE